ncbi:MAG TPA: anthranilate phosphoribosyltransferase [Gemmatimonadales bacterium]|nr:anthranilate phosphoribosyltransferase [Gemmatimonadales bacterium]
MDPLKHALRRIADAGTLSSDETAAAFGVIMRGEATPALIGALLLALRARGETAEEVAGAAQALRAAMVSVRLGDGAPLVDTCGTGGGAVGTFNVSTAAAFITAAAGARVAKHGNRSHTSKCGSADVLEALGIDILLPPEQAAAQLDDVGMVFFFAPNYHPAMRHVGPTRKELGVPTIMNLVGPLANPAGVLRQVVGVADAPRARLMAEALLQLGAEHALVVHGEIGMDEISPTGRTEVWEVRDRMTRCWLLDPSDYGLEWDATDELAGAEPAGNARRIERLLAGEKDEAARRAVLLNAAAGIYVAGLADSYAESVKVATQALASGRAAQVLSRMRVR